MFIPLKFHRFSAGLLFLFFIIYACKDKSKVELDPIINDFSPRIGSKNTIVTITGERFGDDLANVKVWFNNKSAEVISISDKSISVKVPSKAFTGPLKVSISERETSSGFAFEYLSSDGTLSNYLNNSVAQYPSGLAFDATNNLYLADYAAHKIFRLVNANGSINSTLIAGSVQGFEDNATGSLAKFNKPSALVIDAQDNIYVADTDNSRIRKISASGEVTTLAGSFAADTLNGIGSLARFNKPSGLLFKSPSEILIADKGNNKLRLLKLNTNEVSNFVKLGLQNPVGMAYNNSGNLIIADQGNYQIKRIGANGSLGVLAGSTLGYVDNYGTAAKFGTVISLVADRNGNIIVADKNNNSIRMVSTSGYVSTIIGKAGSGNVLGNVKVAKISLPDGIAIDKNGVIYFFDSGNNAIRKLEFD